MKLTPAQIKKRDLILFGEDKDWEGIPDEEGEDFIILTLTDAITLLEAGIITPESPRKVSPSAYEIVIWLVEHCSDKIGVWVEMAGYAYAPHLEDTEIIITDLSIDWSLCDAYSRGTLKTEFLRRFSSAYDLVSDSVTGTAAWIDMEHMENG